MAGKDQMSDDDQMRLGAQQAALLQLQKQQDEELAEKIALQTKMLEADQQTEAMGRQQQRMLAEQQRQRIEEDQQQRKRMEERQLMEAQMAALAEKQNEERMKRVMMEQPGAPPILPPPPTGAPPSAPPPGLPPQLSGMQRNVPGPPGPMPGAPSQLRGPPPPMSGPPPPIRPPVPASTTPMPVPPGQMSGPPSQIAPSMGQMPRAPAPMQAPPPVQIPPGQMAGPPRPMGAPPAQMPVPPAPPGQMPGAPVTGPPPGPPGQMPPRMSAPPRMPPPPGTVQHQNQQMGGPPMGQMPPRGPPPMGMPPRPPGGPPGHMPPGPMMPGPPSTGPPTSMAQAPPINSSGPPGPPRPGPPSTQPPDTRPSDTEPAIKEVKLPQALEKILAFKDVRAQQVGVRPEDIEKVAKGEVTYNEAGESEVRTETKIEDEYQEDEEDEEEEMQTQDDDEDEEEEEEEEKVKRPSAKETKNKRRKKKKKRSKRSRLTKQPDPDKGKEKEKEEDVEIEYVTEDLQLDKMDPMYRQFARIFETFKITEPERPKSKEAELPEKKEEAPKPKKALDSDDEDEDEDDGKKKDDDDRPKISKKKLKKMSRLSVAELKQLVSRPDVVEMHDVTAHDPKLLVSLKATRNSVTVPRHWCFKRKYLQGKRGIEKPPFELPEFIQATGIMEMRAALQEKEDQRSMKQKMRERVRPKMGKIEIDYKKLHDAFFRWQTKPKMSIHGDLYYEGKEFETRLREKKPGNLTEDLRVALGMPVGSGSENVPPPWLIAMQRYGPPPSYPNLKIPGLNAPIPEGCSFGYHAGGWGKPPVDENGKPLYGDVFGTSTGEKEAPAQEEEIDRTRWGELESESESEEESEESSEEEMEEQDATGLITPAETGMITPSGVTSVPIGMETPDMIELRKKRIEDSMDAGGDTPALYQVIPEKKAAPVGGAMMGSAHVYDLSTVAGGRRAPGEKGAAEGIEVALNPDELDLDTAAMQAKYEQSVKEQQSQLRKEDLSDMVAEHAAKQQKKRKKQQQHQDQSKGAKKYKEFKF